MIIDRYLCLLPTEYFLQNHNETFHCSTHHYWIAMAARMKNYLKNTRPLSLLVAKKIIGKNWAYLICLSLFAILSVIHRFPSFINFLNMTNKRKNFNIHFNQKFSINFFAVLTT